MARSIDAIFYTNWQETESNIPIPQYSLHIKINWTNEDGNQHEHEDDYLFPNVLADMPLKVRRRYAEEMMTAKARVALGINSWEDYE
ncbi:MAG: hypothetical protein PVJ86_00055 [Phycisphaerales bacterium]|jgi:hypothetical protein